MTLSQQERDGIREEELVRLLARKEMKRQGRPQMAFMMIIWTAVLTAVAMIIPRVP